jgi:LmbE family N-acetylglucosaminyl deacetylase
MTPFFKKIYLKFINHFINKKFAYPKPLSIDENSRILLLSPHPDDESIGCGGLMLKYPQNIDIICITDGGKGIPDLDENNTIKFREEEFTNAMEYANISKFSFLKIKDSELSIHKKKLKKIDLNGYDLILIPNIFDQHPDHFYLSKFIFDEIKSNKLIQTSKIGFYEVWNPLPLANFYLDISKLIKKKKKLIELYKSQCEIIDYQNRIIALNKYRGMSCDSDYAEVYMIYSTKEFVNLMTSIKI